MSTYSRAGGDQLPMVRWRKILCQGFPSTSSTATPSHVYLHSHRFFRYFGLSVCPRSVAGAGDFQQLKQSDKSVAAGDSANYVRRVNV